MMHEYKVVPAPRRAEKAKGLKTTPERFAHALAEAINALAREGWEYVRAEMLPCEERAGLTGRRVTDQHVLVFRRALPTFEENVTERPPLRPVEASSSPRLRAGGLAALAGLGVRPAPRSDAPPLRAPGNTGTRSDGDGNL
jgi:hypothetical protein